ncbi:MAG: EAL domain-containing protein, partial [Clostridia bacterium]|nr:EAL domain-containing protein [Clostridia bacterium]
AYVFIVDSNVKFLTYDIDKLTGLPGNRRFMEAATTNLEMYRRNSAQSGYLFLYINISKFKIYNVKHGIEKGDVLLKATADIIKQEFPRQLVSRFTDDHFAVMAEDTANIIDKIITIHNRVHELRDGANIGLKVGIYRVMPEDTDAKICCDLAKIACDSIHTIVDRFYCFYDAALSRTLEITDYVIENIDNAIEKGYIKVYYQPVIRTVSGALCGMEALARWIDPEKGFLSPSEFIAPLESSKQIYKLDAYVINEICRNYREKMNRGEVTVPVSFNLSRLDFVTCNIFGIVEDAVEKYNVPRDAVNIEITESVFAKDATVIIREVERFRNKGYHVWMDDFGSGYSSLNVLKDYTFDELKIDMVFLSSFTKKSKDIIRSTVDMANSLGIQNLAEGVETQEQFDFLKSIGCGKVQGFYFGKPLPYEECMRLCKDKGMEPETSERKNYYDCLNKINLNTDVPLAIVEYDTKNIRFIYANETYKKAIGLSADSDLRIAENYLNNPNAPTMQMFKNFFDGAIESGKKERLTYSDKGQIICVEIELISSCKNRYMYRSTVQNVMFYSQQNASQEGVESILRNICRIYDRIHLWDISTDSIQHILTICDGEEKLSTIYNNIGKTLKNYIAQTIHSSDAGRFEEFSDLPILLEKLEKGKKNYVAGYFKTRTESGEYCWAIHAILLLPIGNSNQFVLLTKFLCDEEMNILKQVKGYCDIKPSEQ